MMVLLIVLCFNEKKKKYHFELKATIPIRQHSYMPLQWFSAVNINVAMCMHVCVCVC